MRFFIIESNFRFGEAVPHMPIMLKKGVPKEISNVFAIFGSEGKTFVIISSKLSCGRCLHTVQKVLRFRNILQKANLIICQTIVRTVGTYSCETWAMIQGYENKQISRCRKRRPSAMDQLLNQDNGDPKKSRSNEYG